MANTKEPENKKESEKKHEHSKGDAGFGVYIPDIDKNKCIYG